MISFLLFFFGGISLFLIGLNTLKENLFLSNSQKLKNIIANLTNNNFKAFLLGIVSTIIIQSSSGITAITIALLSSNILNIKAAILIILGSNIGTCITPFIFAININQFSLVFIFVGYIITNIKIHKFKLIGNIIISLGLIFLGLNFLDSSLKYFNETSFFYNFLKSTSSPFLSIIISTIIASLLQSSSATIAITQNLYKNNFINLISALGFMLGSNIGTCIASLIMAINTSKESKLVIKINIVFNTIGALLFFIFLTPFKNILYFLENFYSIDKSLTVAYSHLIFNLVSTIFVFIFFEKFISLFKVDSKNKK